MFAFRNKNEKLKYRPPRFLTFLSLSAQIFTKMIVKRQRRQLGVEERVNLAPRIIVVLECLIELGLSE